MDQEQPQFDQPTKADVVGQSPTQTDNDGQRPTLSHETNVQHTITSKEATKIFEQAGLSRSQRSIERYCKGEKLECIVDPDEERYYITRESIDKLITHLKEIQTRHQGSQVVDPRPTMPDHDGQSPQESEPKEANDEDAKDEQVKSLRRKLREAQILGRANELFAEKLSEERASYIEQQRQDTYLIGKLETELEQIKQLPAPKERAAEDSDTADEAVEAKVSEPQSPSSQPNEDIPPIDGEGRK